MLELKNGKITYSVMTELHHAVEFCHLLAESLALSVHVLAGSGRTVARVSLLRALSF